MKKFLSLRECLYKAFVFADECNSQDPDIMWAIHEGMERLERLEDIFYFWRSVTARKGHECVRGCKIQERDTYFRYRIASWTTNDDLKLCATCMAMILYFKEVYLLPPHYYNEWDTETKQTVMIKKDGT